MHFKEKDILKNQLQRELADLDLDFDFDKVFNFNDEIGDFWLRKNAKTGSGLRSSKKQFLSFILVSLLILSLVPAAGFITRGAIFEENLKETGKSAYENLISAGSSIINSRYSDAGISFKTAYKDFLEAENEIKKMGGAILAVFSALPGFKKVSSGENLLQAGKYFSLAGIEISRVLDNFSGIAEKFLPDVEPQSESFVSKDLTGVIKESVAGLISARRDLISASFHLNKIKIKSLPENIRNSVLNLKEKLPLIIGTLDNIEYYGAVFQKILGSENPQKYLLLFTNPSEMRATGGFIGSYGIVDVFKGKIVNIFIDNIFNPDGQLKEKIVPPKPIQRVSTAWSMHDANWFFDFPTSAKKITFFYEKTGGATPDGVISITSNFIEDILKVTGPIEMPEYNLVITSDNFIEKVQYEVEVGYDKELNEPKKILKDFMPKIISKISRLKKEEALKILELILKNLKSRDLMFYSLDSQIQDFILAEGWSGKVIEVNQDYLAVVHSNLNGFKTDRVIDEKINLNSEIKTDGRIINTLTIRKFHKGGEYNYWNKVNTDYLRIYVPKGSQLISARGFTKDEVYPPIDYEKQGFKIDKEVLNIEKTIRKSEEFIIDIFEESEKTVFGGWVFVSPKESVTVEIKYVLPFKIDFDSAKSQSHSIYIQKQPGLNKIKFDSLVELPIDTKIVWNYPSDLKIEKNKINFSNELNRDYFYGFVFEDVKNEL